MPLTHPRDSVIAVVGDGFGSLMVHTTARYLGFAPEHVTIYGPSPSPVATYEQFAANLGQTVLRSESESHFLPADWPTFAQIDAWSRRSPAPLVRSIRRKYNPGVAEIMTEARVVARALDWDGVRLPIRVGWVQRLWEPEPHFELYDEDAQPIGRARHVVLALGHGPLSFPPVLAAARRDPATADRVVQAYEAKTYAPGGRYVVVGAGIASVNEWANILETGGSVISLLRNPVPDEQDLNTPRCLFEALGIDQYLGLSFEQRVAFLGSILKGTSPTRRGWGEIVSEGRAQGRFEELQGEISRIEPGPQGLSVEISHDRAVLGWAEVDGVVAGTGFTKSPLTIPLIRRLVSVYGVPVSEGRLRLATNCGVPGIDVPESRLAMMGIMANSVIPHADTIAGVKYITRRFVADCARAEGLRQRPPVSRLALQLRLARATARSLRSIGPTRQLA